MTPGRVGFALVMSLPLVFRRRAPLAVITILSAATVAWALSADQPESGTMPFPAILLAIFSVALYARTAFAGSARPRARLDGDAHHSALAVLRHDAERGQHRDPVLLLGWAPGPPAGWCGAAQRSSARHTTESGELARSAVADERARIARELHDVVAHSISIVAVQAGAAEQLLEKDIDAAREHLAAVRRTAREAMTEMRRVLDVLHEDDATYVPQPGLSRRARSAGRRGARRASPVELIEDGRAALSSRRAWTSLPTA